MLKNNYHFFLKISSCALLFFVNLLIANTSFDSQNNFESKAIQTSYSAELYDANIQAAIHRHCSFLGDTDLHLYHALDDLATEIYGKDVAVIGSRNAWYESILLVYGANPIVIDSNPIQTTDSRVTYLTKEQYNENPQQFDLILNITNIPRAGLGLNGGLIDPNGDFSEMEYIKKMLTPTGKILLAVPVGPDQLVENSHRVYGEKRLKMLLKGWKIMRYYGFTSEQVFYGVGYCPVFLLQSK